MPEEKPTLAAAWSVATAAAVGSLYYDAVLALDPCRLCWSTLRRVSVAWIALPLSAFGAGLAAYHSWLQVVSGDSCTVAGCGTVQHRTLGLTIPNQALVAFLLIGLAVGHVALRRRR
ncbi:disulfide bond formation protein B [Halobacteriales archaeon SW_12_71_31]|nr:MAG: disulfide bond formation protein B [Halobacteriales archaeon SW_12_71_31]